MALSTPSSGALGVSSNLASGCASLGSHSVATGDRAAAAAPSMGVGARLDNRWVLWRDRWDDDGSGAQQQTLLQIGAATRATDFWHLVTRTTLGGLEANCSFQVFKSEVRPEWEDPANIQGGHFRISVAAPAMESDVQCRTAEAKLWFNLLVSVVGSRFLLSSSINGIGVTRKRNGCVISLWIDTADPSVVRTVRREVQEQLPAGSFVVRFIAHALLTQTSHTTHIQVALDHRRTHSAPTHARFINLELDPVPQLPVGGPGDIVVIAEESASLSAAALMSRSVARADAASGVLNAMCAAIAAPLNDSMISDGSSPQCPTLPSHCSTASQRTRQHQPYAGAAGFAMPPPHWRSKSDTHAKTTVPDTAATLGRYAYRAPGGQAPQMTHDGSPPPDVIGHVAYSAAYPGPQHVPRPSLDYSYQPPPRPQPMALHAQAPTYPAPPPQPMPQYPQPQQPMPQYSQGYAAPYGVAAPQPQDALPPQPIMHAEQVHVGQPRPLCPVHGLPPAPTAVPRGFAPQQLAHAAMSQGTWLYSGGAEVPFAQPVQPIHATAQQQQQQPRQPARGHTQAAVPGSAAPEAVKPAVEVEQQPPPPPAAVKEKEPPQQTKSDAPMFICRGWLFPAGLNRKERRRIQFAEDTKVLEDFPGARFVGPEHADGPCQDDLTPLEPRREDQVTA